MPQITLTFTVKKGLRVLAAFQAHNLTPLRNPKTGEPLDEIHMLKRGLITLAAREVHTFEQGQAVQIARVAMDEAEESVEIDPDIAS